MPDSRKKTKRAGSRVSSFPELIISLLKIVDKNQRLIPQTGIKKIVFHNLTIREDLFQNGAQEFLRRKTPFLITFP